MKPDDSDLPKFGHENLDAYARALEFNDRVELLTRGFPRGRAYLADQLVRAATSIVLNLAEGSLLDLIDRYKLADPALLKDARALLRRVVSMLVKLAKSQEGRRGVDENG